MTTPTRHHPERARSRTDIEAALLVVMPRHSGPRVTSRLRLSPAAAASPVVMSAHGNHESHERHHRGPARRIAALLPEQRSHPERGSKLIGDDIATPRPATSRHQAAAEARRRREGAARRLDVPRHRGAEALAARGAVREGPAYGRLRAVAAGRIIVFATAAGHDQMQHKVAAMLGGVIIAWITEPIPIPVSGLIGGSVLVLLGVGGDEGAEAVLAPFGLRHRLHLHRGVHPRPGDAPARPRHDGSPSGSCRSPAWRSLLPGGHRIRPDHLPGLGVISNTATVAMLMPTHRNPGRHRRRVQDKHEADGTLDRFDATRMRVGFAMMLMLAYGASVGGLLTPVGSPPNLIGRELIEKATGEPIPFGTWMAMAFRSAR